MGYLMKEALKTLCGVNQWSYAVLWKIGYQNPSFLIWEECFCQSPSFSNLSRIPVSQDPEFTFRDFQPTARAGDEVHLLIKMMMTDNHVNIVGEGLVGRVAFTGIHQWILSENYFGGAHPPEVLKELSQQFSAGMKTVAVIPVLPHGVVQFGSYLTITESLGFVNAVNALILQLDMVPGMSYVSKEPTPRIGVPTFHGNSTASDFSIKSNMIESSYGLIPDGFYHARSAIQTSVIDNQTSYSFARETRNNLQNTIGTFHVAESSPCYFRSHSYDRGAKIDPAVNIDGNLVTNGAVKAEVIPTSSMTWSAVDLPCHSSTSSNHGAIRCTQQSDRVSRCLLSSPGGILQPAARANSSLISNSNDVSVAVPLVELSGMSLVSGVTTDVTSTDSGGLLTSNFVHGGRANSRYHHVGKKLARDEFYACARTVEQDAGRAHGIPLSQRGENFNMVSHFPIFDEVEKTHSGDDLFDILGADFKNKLFDGCWSSFHHEPSPSTFDLDSNTDPSERDLTSSQVLPTCQGNSAGGVFLTSSDHLLDAVVSSSVHPTVKQSIDDSVSCRTTLTNASIASVSDVAVSDQMKGELFVFPKYLAKPVTTGSCSLKHDYTKEDSGTRSQNSTIHGSELSSWVEKVTNTKMNSSLFTGCSKKPDEANKTNRKRLKPGENPRPRPKDRQMIQDRVKELREIVPSGAKCSIDALLERTIKHMLFLQSVTKHADKLKQTGNSEVISNNGGMLLKDNVEGGATWAYEVGSHPTFCPIIVEDLNQPRQMLVEMLCEERGLFLEIADIIRGLGLCILKGVMETRNSKIWARFAVEADRDVTRMEIFMALVRLLDQSSKGCVPQANDASYDKMAAQPFQQAPSSLPMRQYGYVESE